MNPLLEALCTTYKKYLDTGKFDQLSVYVAVLRGYVIVLPKDSLIREIDEAFISNCKSFKLTRCTYTFAFKIQGKPVSEFERCNIRIRSN